MKLKKYQKRLIGYVIAVTSGLFLATVILLFSNVEKMLFRPPAQTNSTVFKKLNVGNEKIAYLHLPGKPDADVILYNHGNASDLHTVKYVLEEFQEKGYGIIGYDYEGYGESTGEPSSKVAYRDAEAVYQYIVDKLKIPPTRIIIYGFSVGSGPACYLAEKYLAKALILEAPFASAFQVVLPFGGLPGDRFPNADRVSKIKIPLLVFHGEQDRVIPIRNGKKVFDAAIVPKQFVPIAEANHNNIRYIIGEKYWQIISNFLHKHQR